MRKLLLVTLKVLLVITMCLMPYPVYAYSYSITAPETISFGTFTAATDYIISPTGIDITANTTDPGMSKVTITVEVQKTNTKGFLTLNGTDTTGTGLANPLEILGGDLSSYSSLESQRTLRNAVAIVTANISDLSVKQTINAEDLKKTAGSYSLIMTFTATFMPP
jgi:hypothetical protein